MGGGPAKETVLCLNPQEEPKAIVSALRKKFPDIDIIYHQVSFTQSLADAHAEVPSHLWKKATVLCTFNSLPEKNEAPHLNWLQLLSAGSNHIQGTPLWEDKDVTITTASGIHGPQIAEWVVMTGLVQFHGYNKLYEQQKKHEWGKPKGMSTVRDRVGLRLGVLGYGSIGRQVGRVAKAMGMEVLAYTAGPKDTKEKKRDSGYIVPGTGDVEGEVPEEWYSGLDKESLHHFLKQDIDWLIVAVPLTKETKHFLSTEEFEILSKRKAFITNIARGPIIDQPALISALKDGKLSGAALDVTDPEPLPADSELWDLENVTVTPHVSGQGTSYTERAFQVLELNLEKRLAGERLVNVVDRGRGY